MNRKNNKGRQTPEQLRKAANDAIAFLRSMVKLVEERGWREVDEEFAQMALGMADVMMKIDPSGAHEKRVCVGLGLCEFFEHFRTVPAPVFRSIVMLAERELRKDVDQLIEQISNEREIPKARQAA